MNNAINKVVVIVILLIISEIGSSQKSGSVALTPPMGWNSWNCFRFDINEEKIKSIADAMVSSGMKDVGYEYIIIDDGWMTNQRDKEGHIVPDSTKFPNGIKPVADYIHSLGLKFGIYSAPGCLTCGGFAGSFGYEQVDANDYASWGVDFLKYDWCKYPKTIVEAKQTSKKHCREAFELMRDCLAKTGRSIVYSVHDKCTDMEHEGALPWVKDVAHMHRTSGDIKDNWNRMLWCLETTVDLWKYAGSGYWNDLDMLEVGNTNIEKIWGEISPVKMTLKEYQTHFSLWCITASPLIAGNDLRNMKPEIIEILTNQEVIAINQDKMGKQGRRIRNNEDIEIWMKELSNNRRAVVLLNKSNKTVDIEVNWSEIGLKGRLEVRDLWQHKNLGKFRKLFVAKNIQSHEALVILIEK